MEGPRGTILDLVRAVVAASGMLGARCLTVGAWGVWYGGTGAICAAIQAASSAAIEVDGSDSGSGSGPLTSASEHGRGVDVEPINYAVSFGFAIGPF